MEKEFIELISQVESGNTMLRIFLFGLVGMALYSGFLVMKRPGSVMFKKSSKNKNKSVELGRVKYIYGDVYITRSKQTYNARPGLKLYKNDILSSVQDGYATVSFGNESIIKLMRLSKIKFIKFKPAHKSEDSKNHFSYRLVEGRMFLEFINPNKKNQVDVYLKQTRVSVRGTQIFLENDTKKNIGKLAVSEGVVKIIDDKTGKNDFVLENQGAVFVGKETWPKPQEYEWLDDLNWDDIYSKLDSKGFEGKRYASIKKPKGKRKSLGDTKVRYEDERTDIKKGKPKSGLGLSKAKQQTIKMLKKLPFYGGKVESAASGIEDANKVQAERMKKLEALNSTD